MRKIMNFIGILFINIIVAIIMVAQANSCKTQLLFEAKAWFGGIPGEYAYAIVWDENGQDYDLFMIPYSQQDQTFDSNYCFSSSPIAVNIVNANNQIVAFYQSKQTYNSNQEAVNVNFPNDFTRVR